MQTGPHKPELDEMSPSQIRVLCEQLLYTMDIEQRIKVSTEIPGIYKMVFGRLPEAVANKMAFEAEEARKDSLEAKTLDALDRVGL
jgi:hypothetical protein